MSCNTNVKFDTPQPVSALNQIDIPEHFIGEYQKEENDKLVVLKDGIVVDFENTTLLKTKYKLDSSLILFKSVHGIYANLMDSTGLWNCFLINSNDSSIIVYKSDLNYIFPDNKQLVRLNNLSDGLDYKFSSDSSLIVTDIDYLNLYHSFDFETGDVLLKK